MASPIQPTTFTAHLARTAMSTRTQYRAEHVLSISAILLTVTGFWKIYVGAASAPTSYHHLHIVTDFVWLFLLFIQLRLVGTRRHAEHRKLGLAVLLTAPLLVATTALLTVYSAYKGVVSGEGDFLIVANVTITLEVALLIVLAFVLRRRRKVHGALLMGTVVLMMGIALFFTLLSFVPMFQVTGPETVYRFQSAGIAAQSTCLVICLAFFARDRRNGWPYLLVASFFVVNELIRSALTSNKLIQPLTEFVGALSQPITFVSAFALTLIILLATGVLKGRTAQALSEV